MTTQELQFMRYWEATRERDKKLWYQLIVGIPIGLLFSLPILFIVFSGKLWYKRADMAANTMTSPYLLIAAVFLIAVFVAIFYKRHQWDRKEQYYQELKAKAAQEGESTVQL